LGSSLASAARARSFAATLSQAPARNVHSSDVKSARISIRRLYRARVLDQQAEFATTECAVVSLAMGTKHPKRQTRERLVTRARELVAFLQDVALGKRAATAAEVEAAAKELDDYLPDLERTRQH